MLLMPCIGGHRRKGNAGMVDNRPPPYSVGDRAFRSVLFHMVNLLLMALYTSYTTSVGCMVVNQGKVGTYRGAHDPAARERRLQKVQLLWNDERVDRKRMPGYTLFIWLSGLGLCIACLFVLSVSRVKPAVVNATEN